MTPADEIGFIRPVAAKLVKVLLFLNFAVPLDDPSIVCACPAFADSPDASALYLDEVSRVNDCVSVLLETCFTAAESARELAGGTPWPPSKRRRTTWRWRRRCWHCSAPPTSTRYRSSTS